MKKSCISLLLAIAMLLTLIPTSLADAPQGQPEGDTAAQIETASEEGTDPQAPASEPDAPTADPGTPADEPVTPTDDPEEPAVDSDTPADEPDTPADEPDTHADEPEAPAEDPEAADETEPAQEPLTITLSRLTDVRLENGQARLAVRASCNREDVALAYQWQRLDTTGAFAAIEDAAARLQARESAWENVAHGTSDALTFRNIEDYAPYENLLFRCRVTAGDVVVYSEEVKLLPEVLADPTEEAQPEVPADEAEAPADEAEAPADEAEAPADEAEAPADEAEAPADKIEAPADEAETPADETEAPADEIEAPKTQEQSEDGEAELEQPEDGEAEALDDGEAEAPALPVENTAQPCGPNLFWEFDEATGTFTITGTGPMNEVGIYSQPAWYDIRGQVTQVVLPEGLTTIANNSFEAFSRVTSIDIPKSVTKIGDNAFSRCIRLTSVNLSKGLTYIGSSAFRGCTSLTKVALPDTVTYLGPYAFWGCTALTDATLSKGLATVQDRAFLECSSLVNLTLPEGLVTIQSDAFASCTSLIEVAFPQGIVNIQTRAFQNCSQLAYISLPATATNVHTDAFSGTAFWNNQPDGFVYLDHVLLGIKNKVAFTGDTLSVAPGTKVIASSAVNGVSALQTLILPDGLTAIGSNAFSYCQNLTTASLPDSIKVIHSSAFYYCKKLADVAIPGNLRTLDSGAFAYCAMPSITLPEGLTAVANDAFQYCEALKTVTLPSTLTSIGSYAFYGTAIQHVYYNGTKAMRRQITIPWDNSPLTGAIWHYTFIDIDEATFPDAAFRQWIMQNLPISGSETEGYQMSASQVASVTAIDCSKQGIADLTGIGEFTELLRLDCSGNLLTDLDLKGNARLKILRCSQNQLQSLAPSSCTELEVLDCSQNQIRYLRLKQLLQLKEVYCQQNAIAELTFYGSLLERIDCSDNHISALNVSEFSALEYLNCCGNALPTLDVSQNPRLQTLICGGQLLQSESLSHGQQGYLFNMAALAGDPALVTVTNAGADYDPATGRLCLAAQPESIGYLYAVGGHQMDVTIPVSGVVERQLEIDAVHFPDEAFRGYLIANKRPSGDDVVGWFLTRYQVANLTELSCPGLGIRSLKGVEWFTYLEKLDVGYAEDDDNLYLNLLSDLDLRANTKLTRLNCSGNPLSSLNLAVNTKLQSLQCSNCQLAALDVSKLSALLALDCSYNNLSSLNLSANKALQVLLCDGNSLTGLILSANTELYQLSCGGNRLSSLNLSKQKKLQYLDCSENEITALSVAGMTYLQYLLCGGNKLKSLNVAKNAYLLYLFVNDNLLTSLNVGSNIHLQQLVCDNNQLKTVTLPRSDTLSLLSCGGNLFEKLDLSSYAYLIGLDCSRNKLTSLDVSSNIQLGTLICSDNRLKALHLPSGGHLTELDCSGNQLEELDLSNSRALVALNCQGNRLTRLDMNRLSGLTLLACGDNRLSSLDLSPCKALKLVLCDGQTPPKQALDEGPGGYCFDLSPLVADLSRVTVSTEGVAFDPATGLVTAADRIDTLSYAYATGFEDMSMQVTVQFASAPVIRVQPESVAAFNGTEAVFTLTASGPDLTYQWFSRKGTGAWKQVPGGTDATLRINAVKTLNGYQYYCLVTNAEGKAASQPATLTVKPRVPVVVTEPQSAAVDSGAPATFIMEAEGAKSRQWQEKKAGTAKWVNVKGATTGTLTVTGSRLNNGSAYRCMLKNADGVAYTAEVTLTVNLHTPVFTVQPEDTTVYLGQMAVFSATAEGAASYQWYTRKNASAKWSKAAGNTARTATLSLLTKAANDGAQFYCVVTNGDGDTASSIVTLKVLSKVPVILDQPKGVVADSGSEAVFTVEAEGAVSCQWQERKAGTAKWVNLKGATGARLTVTAALSNQGSAYRCTVKNGKGSTNSAEAILTVILHPPVIVSEPKDAAVAAGETAVFTVEAEGAVSYQWYTRKNAAAKWSKAAGASARTARLTVNTKPANNGAEYYCLITNRDGSVSSSIVTLILQAK